MAASVQLRPQKRDLGMVMREVDEDLAIFLGIRNAEMQTIGNDRHLVEHSDEIDNSTDTEPMPDGLLTPNASQIKVDRIAAADDDDDDDDDDVLKLKNEGSDFDWLLAQADTSLLPSVEVFSLQNSETTHNDISKVDSNSQEYKLACDQPSMVSNSSSQPAKSTILESSSKRPSSSFGNRKPTSRSSTPSRRSSLPAKPKPSRAPTPTSRTTIPLSKLITTQAISSTPSKAPPRSSTPSTRPSLQPSSYSGPNSSTPTPAPDQASMVRKTGTVVLKNPTRQPSSMSKSRPSKLLEVVSISRDATQHPKSSTMPKRPASASRGRPSGPATNFSSSNGKPRQKSCSPARVRVSNGTSHKLGSRSRGYGNGGDNDYVNPVLMGTQMVERVVNMRKLAPPKPDECLFHNNPKKSSKASGFGRSLSSRSLEMAVRHMDIRRSIADGIRPLATGVLSSSFSAQSLTKSGSHGTSESPVASSSDDSESSLSFNSRFTDENEMNTSLNMK